MARKTVKDANYLKSNGLYRQEHWELYGIAFKGDRKEEGGWGVEVTA
jgi:hypothetical protein